MNVQISSIRVESFSAITVLCRLPYSIVRKESRYGVGSCNQTLRRLSLSVRGWPFIQLSEERSGLNVFDLSP
jgi:hypothetical protein